MDYPMLTPVFVDSLNGKVKIGPTALSVISSFIQDDYKKAEAGGVLLGRFLIGSNDVVVDQVTMPMTSDKRSRFHFFRSARSHQKLILEAWTSSQGTCNYLGEWHTHPESDPHPSGYDFQNWQKKLQFDKFDNDFLYFVIVGTTQINVWKGYRNNLSFEKLDLITNYSSVKAN
jgi:integrative and conjugative element protein (TIGR02256 family)